MCIHSCLKLVFGGWLNVTSEYKKKDEIRIPEIQIFFLESWTTWISVFCDVKNIRKNYRCQNSNYFAL